MAVPDGGDCRRLSFTGPEMWIGRTPESRSAALRRKRQNGTAGEMDPSHDGQDRRSGLGLRANADRGLTTTAGKADCDGGRNIGTR